MPKYIRKNVMLEAEYFDSAAPPYPHNIKADAASPTGYSVKMSIKPYATENPNNLPESVNIKICIPDKSYISIDKSGRPIFINETDFLSEYEVIKE